MSRGNVVRKFLRKVSSQLGVSNPSFTVSRSKSSPPIRPETKERQNKGDGKSVSPLACPPPGRTRRSHVPVVSPPSPSLKRRRGRGRSHSIFARSTRVTILGQGGVGKSALTVQFISHRFLGEYDPTIEDAYVKHFTVDMEPIRIEIFDTAGQFQDGTSMARERYLMTSDAFVVVYSITDWSSYVEAIEIINWLRKHRRRASQLTDAVIALVANKSDLQHLQKVPVEQGRSYAADHGCLFFCTNAAEGHQGVDEVFSDVIRSIRREEMEERKFCHASSSPILAQKLGVKRVRQIAAEVRQTRSVDDLSLI
eukprot:m.154856 g.154856  ORF g.154856 m.154856 type:complete len:310 (+) comp38646_c3_seq22:1280-2209(+)